MYPDAQAGSECLVRLSIPSDLFRSCLTPSIANNYPSCNSYHGASTSTTTMIELGEWLAITSLVMQVVAAVHGVIKIFEKAQNAPKELEELRRSLLRLHDNCKQIQTQGQTAGSFPLQQYDIDEIRNTLEQCKRLLDDYRDIQSANGVLRAVWGAQNHDEVVRYQTLIDRHFVQILLPFWMKILCRTPFSPNEEDRTVVPLVGNLPVRKKSCVPREQVDSLARGLEQLNKDESPSESKKTLQQLDKVLQQCWQTLGLPVDNANTIPLPAGLFSIPYAGKLGIVTFDSHPCIRLILHRRPSYTVSAITNQS